MWGKCGDLGLCHGAVEMVSLNLHLFSKIYILISLVDIFRCVCRDVTKQKACHFKCYIITTPTSVPQRRMNGVGADCYVFCLLVVAPNSENHTIVMKAFL